MNGIDSNVRWRKSSYSGASNGDCVEVGVNVPGVTPVRDSKDPHGPALTFSTDTWVAFLADVKAGHYPTA